MGVRPSSRWKDLPEPSDFLKQLNLIQTKKKKSGQEFLDLSEGDPVIFGHVNQSLSKHLVDAATNGLHMYPEQTPWRTELCKAIYNFEKDHRGIKYDLDNTIIGPGVAGCFRTLHYSMF